MTSELIWEIVYTSPSLTGVRAAALAGLAITPLPASALIAGLRILGLEEGLPRLPDLEFSIYSKKARPNKAAAALTAVLLMLARGPSRPGESYEPGLHRCGPSGIFRRLKDPICRRLRGCASSVRTSGSGASGRPAFRTKNRSNIYKL